MAEFKYEVKERYGVLSQTERGWTTEVNLISWNDNPAKIDIRSWSPDHEKMGKGITLTSAEARKLKAILEGINF